MLLNDFYINIHFYFNIILIPVSPLCSSSLYSGSANMLLFLIALSSPQNVFSHFIEFYISCSNHLRCLLHMKSVLSLRTQLIIDVFLPKLSIICFILCHLVLQWPICWQSLLQSCEFLNYNVLFYSSSYYSMARMILYIFEWNKFLLTEWKHDILYWNAKKRHQKQIKLKHCVRYWY